MPRYKPKTEEAVANHRRVARAYNRRTRSGFSDELMAVFTQLQEGRCGICKVKLLPAGQHEDSVVGDHDHALSKGHMKHQRGLLCRSCNITLGTYEKYLRPRGLEVPAFDAYLRAPPRTLLSETQVPMLAEACVRRGKGKRTPVHQSA